MLPGHLLPYRASLPEKKQVHGIRIVDVTQTTQRCGEADGFYTTQPGILLSVLTADCLPVIFSRNDGSAIAAVHAGWRGLLDGILEQLAARISRDDSTANWVASIGPAAGPCCYEVNEELVTRFKQQLPLPATLISPVIATWIWPPSPNPNCANWGLPPLTMPEAALSVPPIPTRISHSALNTPATVATVTDASKILRIRALPGETSTQGLLLPAGDTHEKTRTKAGFLYS
ncbi:hypothetical protein SPRA44_370010 [Serratia proteamaculans]|nr:hypothetical protein SPRA44_370010 [Serratia proteamaculans]